MTHVLSATDDTVLRPLADVSARHELDPLAQRLLELRDWLADDLLDLEAALVAVERGDGPGQGGRLLPGTRVRSAVQHLLRLPGKRIRPLCVLIAARLGGRTMDGDVRAMAVACELVHAATLLHDDVIDDSSERRGAPAARILYGNSASILAGDHLLVEALRLVQGVGTAPLLVSLLDVISQMVAAEALQLERRGRFEPERDIYLQVIRGKTAALFHWGLRAGGMAAGLDEAALTALGRVGMSLGMAFQLVDDVLDLEGDSDVTGKDALVDLREGKMTWPVILGAESDPHLAQELALIASEDGRELDTARAQHIVGRLRASGALQATRAYALRKADEACSEINALPNSQSRQALKWVIESAVHRAR